MPLIAKIAFGIAFISWSFTAYSFGKIQGVNEVEKIINQTHQDYEQALFEANQESKDSPILKFPK